MTREKAIEILQRKTTIPEVGECFDDICEAFDIAIEALKQEQCEDCVRRQDVIESLNNHWLSGSCAKRIIDEQIEGLHNLPSVTPSRPKGEWIDGFCSKCGYDGGSEAIAGNLNWCPVCGVDMRGD